jgi:hypothetical protein
MENIDRQTVSSQNPVKGTHLMLLFLQFYTPFDGTQTGMSMRCGYIRSTLVCV